MIRKVKGNDGKKKRKGLDKEKTKREGDACSGHGSRTKWKRRLTNHSRLTVLTFVSYKRLNLVLGFRCCGSQSLPYRSANDCRACKDEEMGKASPSDVGPCSRPWLAINLTTV